jgi:hypothetical protein
MKIQNKKRLILGVALLTVLSVVKYFYGDKQTRNITMRGVVIAFSYFALANTILILLLIYIGSSRKLIWKLLVIMAFASIPAVLSAWDWYVKDYANSDHPVRDTMLQFLAVFFLMTLMFAIVPLYVEYKKRREEKRN